MVTAVPALPEGRNTGPTLRTRPGMEACTSAESSPDASPMRIPSRTACPGPTVQRAGSPACWCIAMTAEAGTGAFRMGTSQV